MADDQKVEFSPQLASAVGQVLNDTSKSLADRFRALFTLRNIGGEIAIEAITKCFADSSALLKHELAYCLGQMGDTAAVPILIGILKDTKQEPMVRHEAGEALGAIGDLSALNTLREFISDPVTEVSETCQIAINRIEWLQNREANLKDSSPYKSVDPAPPSGRGNVATWREELTAQELPLFQRYRAMFALRNTSSEDAVNALTTGLSDKSALFKHEVAYVLGQMQQEAAVPALRRVLEDSSESGMVRHECAEALGSIATVECFSILERYLDDSERVVRESCQVALDMCTHKASGEFQYANTAVTLQTSLKQ